MKFKTIAAAVALLGGVSGAMAVTVAGTHFDISYTGTGLFGAPTIVGDAILWAPSAFSANTSSGVALIESTFVMTITAKAGWSLTSFGLVEDGDYTYYGASNVVAAGGELRVTNLASLAPTLIDNIDVTSGAFVVQPSVIPFPTGKWTAAAGVNLSTTKASATIENLLFAAAADITPLDYAFIQKKDVVLSIGVSPVPEPETLAMMLAGLGALGFLALRRPRV